MKPFEAALAHANDHLEELEKISSFVQLPTIEGLPKHLNSKIIPTADLFDILCTIIDNDNYATLCETKSIVISSLNGKNHLITPKKVGADKALSASLKKFNISATAPKSLKLRQESKALRKNAALLLRLVGESKAI